MRKLLITVKKEDDKKAFEVNEMHKIMYMESFEGNTKAYCYEGKENLIKKCLSQVEKHLPKEKFFKIHKSIIINIDYLKGINVNVDKTVLLHNGKELKIAHRNYKGFMEFLKSNFEVWG